MTKQTTVTRKDVTGSRSKRAAQQVARPQEIFARAITEMAHFLISGDRRPASVVPIPRSSHEIPDLSHAVVYARGAGELFI